MSFTVGLNVPWVECGHDFGPRPPEWSGAPPTDWGRLERELGEAREDGVEVARFWVLAGGVNYPVGRDPDDVFARRGDRFVRRGPLPTVPDAFLRDFEGLLRAGANAGVRMVPVLCSFELFFPREPQGRRVVSGGRGPVALGEHDDEAATHVNAFLDATLRPMLEVARGHAEAIEAFEVANEPDWVVRGGPLHVRLHGRRIERMPKTVTPHAMCTFLGEAVRRIDAAGLPATIGFKQLRPKWLTAELRRTLGELAARGRFLHQVHYYPSLHEPLPLPPASRSPFPRVVVGEMPIAHGRWLDPFFMRWPDGGPSRWAREADSQRYLQSRLELVAERGYDAAWLWSAHGTDAASGYGPSQRAQIRRFVASRRR
ncbi:MAG: hypothetical protein H6722_23135 [Sandaracinus sp.]|nr:hypothetical protein [Sandaracinus sp.]